MGRTGHVVEIHAPLAEVWPVMIDIGNWASWASPLNGLDALDPGPMRVGSRGRVRPKWLPSSVWVVTEYEADRLFTWQWKVVPGLRLIGGHELTPRGDTTRLWFWFDTAGRLGPLAGLFLRRTIFERNTRLASEGIRRYMESRRMEEETPD